MALKTVLEFISHIKQSYNTKESTAVAVTLVADTAAAVLGDENKNKSLSDIDLSIASNQTLLDSFEKLAVEDKVLMLHSAILFHKKEISHQDQKLRFFKEVETFNLKSWLIKASFTLIAAAIIAFSATFIYLLIKNGIFTDLSIIATLFRTLQEVLGLIFLNTAK